MLYVKETSGSVDAVCNRLEEAVKAHNFGVMAIIDLQAKMRDKGVEFKNECRIFEVCNPIKAKEVLNQMMSISTALPCRISVFEEDGVIKVATILPTQMLRMFGADELEETAAEVEEAIKAMIDEAVRK
ncbi:MAG: DUF302 domain-containing protein [Verrucomicrobia bacterium]|nr:DUF302 domain-containing protein [Verrucomicrobiota bacterium]MCF7707433.1 DUF302 domain-containing protein [Verrucomicrobiota bacterium]